MIREATSAQRLNLDRARGADLLHAEAGGAGERGGMRQGKRKPSRNEKYKFVARFQFLSFA